MLRSEGEIARKRAQAKKERDDKRERERRLSLAQYRDRVRRRKIADGLPLPEELKEQEWERLIARGDVSGHTAFTSQSHSLSCVCMAWMGL